MLLVASLAAVFQAAADCAPAPPGLIAWWAADGNFLDLAGDHNGTPVGGVGFAPGLAAEAFSLDGLGGRIQVAPSESLNLRGALTIEAWIKPSSNPSDETGMIVRNGLNYDELYGFEWHAAGDIRLSWYDGVFEYVFSPTSSVLPDVWTHVAVTKTDQQFIRLYVNGSEVASGQGTLPTSATPAGFNIGSTQGPEGTADFQDFQGLIDEVSIYNRALSASEIAAIYAAGSAGKCGKLRITTQPQSQLGYWGKAATFSVSATNFSTSLLSYQWVKDSTPIPDATNALLVLTNLQATNGGTYTVVVSDSDGNTITSAPAYLTVNPAGVSIALYPGVTIDGVAGFTYGVQMTANLSNTNSWIGVANVTLTVPTQIWYDSQPASLPQRYYRVLPGPITIP